MASIARAGSSRDPLGLDRLAEELETREYGKDSLDGQHDLPAYVPLAHDNPHLAAEAFNVEEFLLSRSYTSLPDLRSELRDYLATLKEELVKLINDDYEAFISLSTDLRGEGARLERLKSPLGDLRAQVLESRNELQRIQDDIQLKLKKRSALREEKAFLHLLLKISDSITRLESLLLISSPSGEDQPSTELHGMKMPSGTGRFEDDAIEDRTRGNQAKHLSRVAAEYTQLLYHVSKARSEKGAFVDESQWRVDRIKSTLSSDLDHLFSSSIIALTRGSGGREHSKDPTKPTEVDKVKWMSDVTECLKIYDVLGLWRDAEEVLRRDVVREFVKKTIYPGALSAPHSPIIPHTPFNPRALSPAPAPPATASLPLRTPYTPFTAFASKQNPFSLANFDDASGGVLAAHAHMLDDSDDPLAGLYNTILRFVERDLKRVMEVAEKVCVKSGSRTRGRGKAGTGVGTEMGGKTPLLGFAKGREEERGFEIMANVVWAEVGRAVMDELGNVVFAAGKPDEFRKHHETTQAFIRSLEFLAPSAGAIEAMRAHPTYVAFERRWQLPVYYQLRWKEIVHKLEEALVVTRLERSTSKALHPFVTPQAAAVWEAISSCWSAQVYIPELGHRLWRLTLQLLSRYKTWLEASLPAFEPPPKVAAAISAEKVANVPGASSNLSRAATPSIPTEAASAESVASDESLLIQFATAVTDIKAMESQTWKLWREEVSMMLPEVNTEGLDSDEGTSLEETLRHALSALTALIPTLSNQAILILSRRGCDALLPMRSIPSQFRAMSSSRRLPTEASHFVSLIFRPLRAFFAVGTADGPAVALKQEFMKSYAEEVFEIVAQRYIYFLTAMKKTEESLRRLKKGKKSTYSLFGTSSASKDDDGRADEEKIRTQMILDVDAFGKEAEGLGVAVNESETYRALRDLAHSNLTDDTQA